MNKQVLHFAHGNGFPSPSYEQILKGLKTRFNCCYIDKLGHAPTFPVKDNWHALVQEVLDSIQSQTDEPVVAVGHSLGGVLSLLAALENPVLFRSVVLLDAPLLSPVRSYGLRVSKKFGFIDRLTPAMRTRGRRTHWQTREDVFGYLKKRNLFKHFTEKCLNDYIDYGMRHDEAGYTLRFDADIEYQIYRTIPHTLSGYQKELKVPTTLIYGAESDVVHSLDRRYMLKQYGISSVKIPGTHMFPFEHPKKTVEYIFQILDSVL